MHVRAVRIASLVAFALCAALLSSPAAACPVSRGTHVVLVSQELDPDVFLWDGSDRLTSYAMGDYDVETVLKHTVLVRAYSRAVTVGCRNDPIHPTFTGSSGVAVFLVGVRVTSGTARGRYGWVLSSDLRGPDGQQLTEAGHPGRRTP